MNTELRERTILPILPCISTFAPSNIARACSGLSASFLKRNAALFTSASWTNEAPAKSPSGWAKAKGPSSNCNCARSSAFARKWEVPMPKRLPKRRTLAEQVEEVVQAMLVSLQPRPEPAPHRDLGPLLAIVRELRHLPRQEFRAALKSDLQRRASVSINKGTESSAAAPARPSSGFGRAGSGSGRPDPALQA